MRRIYSTGNSAPPSPRLRRTRISVLLIAVFVLTILISEPCFSGCEFEWKPGEGLSELSNIVYALTVCDTDGNGPQGKLLVAGGEFITAGGVNVNRIAAWDGNSWKPLGSGLNSYVNSLTIYNGELIAGGWFNSAGGIDANFIARWDGSNWQPLGSGMESSLYTNVNALSVYNGKLIAGGDFTIAGGVSANYIAAWDGDSWRALGSGMNNIVSALTVYKGQLIAGGYFTTASDVDVNYVASWNGSNWQALGSGMNNYVYALTVYNGELIAGGLFTTAGGVDVNNVAAWNGSNWHPLGWGVGGVSNPSVHSLSVYNGELIAGGWFTSAGGIDANYIAQWDGSSWQPLGSGIVGDYYSYVFALTAYNGELIAGGDFTTVGDYASPYWARWGVPEAYKGDLNHDCQVDYSDVERFVERWLDEDCLYNGWCYEADLNYDLSVDFLDYADLAASWRRGEMPADIDGDRDVDFVDFAILASQWLEAPGVPSADIAPPGGDGIVDIRDLSLLADNWLLGVIVIVPEEPNTTNALVSHWKFDEGGGTIAYDSAGNNDGTINGNPQWVAGKVGQWALDCDGDGDYVQVPDDDSLTPPYEITIAFWLYNRGGQTAGIYKHADCPDQTGKGSPGDSRAYYFFVESNLVYLVVHQTRDFYDSIGSIGTVSLNQWHHLAATFDHGQVAVYIDGQLDNTKILSVTSIMNDAQPLIIGGYWEYCTPAFLNRLNGRVDDVRIYNEALTAEEIEQIYEEGL
jgi:hypothetical protein